MFRLKHWITIAAVCITALSCAVKDDGRVNMEILLSSVWRGEGFAVSTTENGTGDPKDEEPPFFLYKFGSDGVLYVYPEEYGTEGEPELKLRYIYTPREKEMVIDTWGVFTVREISVGRLWLEGIKGSLDLRYYTGTGTISGYQSPDPGYRDPKNGDTGNIR